MIAILCYDLRPPCWLTKCLIKISELFTSSHCKMLLILCEFLDKDVGTCIFQFDCEVRVQICWHLLCLLSFPRVNLGKMLYFSMYDFDLTLLNFLVEALTGLLLYHLQKKETTLAHKKF